MHIDSTEKLDIHSIKINATMIKINNNSLCMYANDHITHCNPLITYNYIKIAVDT